MRRNSSLEISLSKYFFDPGRDTSAENRDYRPSPNIDIRWTSATAVMPAFSSHAAYGQ